MGGASPEYLGRGIYTLSGLSVGFFKVWLVCLDFENCPVFCVFGWCAVALPQRQESGQSLLFSSKENCVRCSGCMEWRVCAGCQDLTCQK